MFPPLESFGPGSSDVIASDAKSSHVVKNRIVDVHHEMQCAVGRSGSRRLVSLQ